MICATHGRPTPTWSTASTRSRAGRGSTGTWTTGGGRWRGRGRTSPVGSTSSTPRLTWRTVTPWSERQQTSSSSRYQVVIYSGPNFVLTSHLIYLGSSLVSSKGVGFHPSQMTKVNLWCCMSRLDENHVVSSSNSTWTPYYIGLLSYIMSQHNNFIYWKISETFAFSW